MANKESPAQQRKVKKVMHEFKKGELKSGGSGKKVKSQRQAVAIALSEAKVPPRKGDSRAKKTTAKSSPRSASSARKTTASKAPKAKSTPRKVTRATSTSARSKAASKGGRAAAASRKSPIGKKTTTAKARQTPQRRRAGANKTTRKKS